MNERYVRFLTIETPMDTGMGSPLYYTLRSGLDSCFPVSQLHTFTARRTS